MQELREVERMGKRVKEEGFIGWARKKEKKNRENGCLRTERDFSIREEE